MPRKGDQKVIVPADTLPASPINIDGYYYYLVRYRIVTEDNNRYSHWSPVYFIPAPPYSDPITS